jgi:hypothetical protein
VKTIVHTNVWYQTSNKFGELIEYILDMKKNILMKYYTGDTAEWIRNL